MLSSTFNRALFAAARNGGKKSLPFRCLSTIEGDPKVASKSSNKEVDPMEVFDSIDTNGDGVLSREEFAAAVEKMNYVSMVA